MATPKTLYRFHDEGGPDGLTVMLQKFHVIGDTACYWLVLPEQWMHLITMRGLSEADDLVKKHRKRVQKGAGEKKTCYETQTQAMKSYLERKRWQAKHAEMAAQRARAGLAAAKNALASGDLDKSPDYSITQENEYIQGLTWDC